MIPKIIHYCWFGGNPKSELIVSCMESWKEHLQDYEIIEWNEENFDLNECQYVRDAYDSKKWAHVSDYVRAMALYKYGGIYLDTDVEIKSSLDKFLFHKAFSGFETKGFPFTALWGTEKGHHWPKKILNYYHNVEFSLKTNTMSVSDLLVNEYGFNPEVDELQVFNNDIFIYPSHYFCLDITNYATHHFEGSWVVDERKFYKELVHRDYHKDQFLENRTFEETVHIVVFNSRVSDFFLLKVLIKEYLKFIVFKWKR